MNSSTSVSASAALQPEAAAPVSLSPAPKATSRIVEIDGVRGVSVAVMIAVHTAVFFATASTQTDTGWRWLMEVGKGAAAFLLCMGISAVLARKVSLKTSMLRAGAMFVGGYVFNLLKFGVPEYLLGGLPDRLFADLGFAPHDPAAMRTLFALGDIFHLAAFSVVAMALADKLRMRAWQAFLLSAVIAGVSPLLWGLRGGGPVLEYVCDLFFSETYVVFFPVFPWLAFPLFGWGLGKTLENVDAEERPFRFAQWCGAGLALTVFAIALKEAYPSTWMGADAYHPGPAAITAATGIGMMTFLLAVGVLRVIPKAVIAAMVFFSRNVTGLYIFSWFAIIWSLKTVGFMAYDSTAKLWAILAGVYAVSLTAVWAFGALKRNKTAANAPSSKPDITSTPSAMSPDAA